MSDTEVVRKFNKIAAEVGLGKVPTRIHPDSVRYWEVKGDFFTFAYIPWKQADGKYYALKYRSGKLVKKVAFGRRKKARERTYKWFCKRREILEQLATKRAAKPSKAEPTKLEILQKKQQKILISMKKMVTKKRRLETLIKKRMRSLAYYAKKIEELKANAN